MAMLVSKLKILAQELTKWRASKTLRAKATKNNILEHLEDLDTLEEIGLFVEHDKIHQDKLRANIEDILMKRGNLLEAEVKEKVD